MSDIKIHAETTAWLPNFYSVDDLLAAVKSDDTKRAARMLSYTDGDMSHGASPYIRIGAARITITLQSRDALVTAQIAALNAKLEQERGNFMQRQAEILDRISKLSALTYEVAA